MNQTAVLRAYVESLPFAVRFDSRTLLTMARREIVDNFIYHNTRNGFIERLARGTFRVKHPDNPPVSPLEVAAHKLAAFGKKIVTLGNSTIRTGIKSNGKEEKVLVVGTDGPSSRFKFGEWLIICKRVGPRKMKLAQTSVGRVLRDLWMSGKITPSQIDLSKLKYVRQSHYRPILRALQKYSPQWLTEIFQTYATFRIT